jgi:hypothetical protein
MFVVGGAAMALAYDAARVTRDVDAVFMPHGLVLEEARQVAEDLGLPYWWLNEQASLGPAGRGRRGQYAQPIRPGVQSARSSRHVEFLAQPGGVDAGLAIRGEEVGLVLELPQHRL